MAVTSAKKPSTQNRKGSLAKGPLYKDSLDTPLYTERHAKSGIDAKLPAIECWANQYPSYEIKIEIPEFTSVCPRTGLPDFGKITIHYMPVKWCLEFKSLKLYLLAYRNLGIFYENVVNRILRDVVRAAKPKWAVVRGEFNARGGMNGTLEAHFPKPIKA